MKEWTAAPRVLSENGVVGGKRRAWVYRTLRTQALHYRFKPGQHLPIGAIAKLLKVSNTPVREALMRLYAEGLVNAIPAKGFFARELRLQELAELEVMLSLMVRHCLEGADKALCSSLKAGSEDRLPALQFKKRVTPLSLTYETEMLFETLGRATGEKAIPVFIHRLCEQTHHIRLLAFESRRIGSKLRQVYAGLVEALRREDRPAALERYTEFSTLFAQALPHLVSHALGAAYLAELTDLANWSRNADEPV